MNTLYSIQMQNVSNFDEHTQRKWIIKRVQERKRLFARTVCACFSLISDWRTIVPHLPQLAAYKPQTMRSTWRGLDWQAEEGARRRQVVATQTECCLTDSQSRFTSHSLWLFTALLSFLSLALHTYISLHIYRSVCPSVCPSLYLSVCLLVRSFVWLSVLGVNYSIQLSREKLPDCRRATGGPTMSPTSLLSI